MHSKWLMQRMHLKELLTGGGDWLPNDLLQSGLWPVSNNLLDHKKLTLSSLQGLTCLVELLTNYFKVEIGSKLLHHFREVPDCQTLATTALSSSQESGALEIMAGVVNIFYLLAGFTYVHDHMRGTRQDNTQESDCKHIYHASVPLDRYLGLLQLRPRN